MKQTNPSWLKPEPAFGYKPKDPVRETEQEIPGKNKILHETGPIYSEHNVTKSQVVFCHNGQILSGVKIYTKTMFGPEIVRYKFRGKEFKTINNIFKILDDETEKH